ncbi:MAG: Sec-independent protein translocase protein TatB [Chloroflexota bacterium]
MDILGIGFPELLLIFIIALMVFGPRRLPELAVKAGKFVADLRNMSSGLMTEWQREITVAARLEELEKTRQEFKEIKQEVQQARQNLAGEAASSVKALDQTRQEVAAEVKSISDVAADGSIKSSPPPEKSDSSASLPSAEPAPPPASTSTAQPDNNNHPVQPPTQPAPPTSSPVEVTREQ